MGNHSPITLINVQLIDTGKGYDLIFQTTVDNFKDYYSCLEDALQDLGDYMEAYIQL